MIIDSHCHLHDRAFKDVPETLARALEHDVWGIIAVGCDAETNDRTLAAVAGYGRTAWPALGFHPEWGQLGDADLEAVEAQVMAHHSRIVALGEVGLPWYVLDGAEDAAALMVRGRQRFDRLLRLAARYDLPVVVHAPHGAAVGALQALKAAGVESAVFHWHKAPADVTRDIVEAGYLVSVTPEVVYRGRDREMVEALPLHSLLVESDGPWAFEGEFSGCAPGPWLVPRAAEEIAKIKRLPVDEVIYEVSVNTCRLFNLMWV
jgi:TatD DNase family protein